ASFRRHADCAAAFAAPSVSGIRCQPLKSLFRPNPTRGTPNETKRRRPDGPHRAHQYSRRFDLRAAFGSAEAWPRAILLHTRQTLPAGRGEDWVRTCTLVL